MKKIIGFILSVIMVGCVAKELIGNAATRFNIVGNLKGDVNMNGVIDAIDASMILSEYAKVSSGEVGNFTTTQRFLADINSDKKINAVDASQILETYAYNATHDEAMPIDTVYFNAQLKLNGKTISLTSEPSTYEECVKAMEKAKAETIGNSTYELIVWKTESKYRDHVEALTTPVYKENEKGITTQNSFIK